MYSQLFLHCVVGRAETVASVFGNYEKRQLNKVSILLLSPAFGCHFSLFEIRSFPSGKITLNQGQDYEVAVVEVE